MSKEHPTPQDRYNKKALRQYVLRLNRLTEPELVEYFETKENKQGYIKKLIRADMEKANK